MLVVTCTVTCHGRRGPGGHGRLTRPEELTICDHDDESDSCKYPIKLDCKQNDRSRLSRTSGARCACGRGRRIVTCRFGMRHCVRHAPTAPRARNRACFRYRDSTGGKHTLIVIAKASHAPKARSRAVGVMIEQAGGSERLGCAWAEPLHGTGSR